MAGSGPTETDVGGTVATEASRLAEEQAALRRVATLVARQSPQAEVFTAIAEELGGVLGVEAIRMIRFETARNGETPARVVASWGAQLDVLRIGERLPIGGNNITTEIFETGRAARRDDYSTADGPIAERVVAAGIASAVGAPIKVADRIWGAMVASAVEGGPLPPDTGPRLTQFTDLMGAAIANAEARAEVQRLADEQAALRRVATLAAQGAPPTDVFDAVVIEVRRLFLAAQVGLMRYEGTEEVTIVGQRREVETPIIRAGMRVPLDGDSVCRRVLETGRPVQLDLHDSAGGTIAEIARASNVSVTLGVPIRVEGVTWGVICASWEDDGAPPPGTEARLAEFAELLDTAIANADSRDQLTASRARVLGAGDEARRRVVRDLHDGAQQRLVHTIVTLKLARREIGDGGGGAASLLDEALDHAEQGNAELRELAHGILPSVLTRGGLRAGVDTLVLRLDLPVEVEVSADRLPPGIEASAYFVVAEALTNVVKHARATRARVRAIAGDAELRLEVGDDGRGGADPDGPGLLGLGDRIAALGGRLTIESPPGGGTVLRAQLPLPAPGSSAPTRADR
ncbi:MAG TPA: GAF domain-containing protein [Solirubrobacterales bacterium]|jgi:signal transduction histidine kinase